jgi:hypothetical protein
MTIRIRKSDLVCALAFVLAISAYSAYRASKAKKHAVESPPYLAVGEAIRYTGDLVGIDRASTSAPFSESNGVPIILCIFSRPCSPCDENILLWNRIASFLKDKAWVFGIVIGKPEVAQELSAKTRLDFDVFVPRDERSFIKALRAYSPSSQTIICLNAKATRVHIGNLSPENAVSIIEEIRTMNNASPRI